MRRYELTVIFPLEEDQQRAGKEQLSKDLSANGVEIESTTEMGDKDLAYEIKKKTRGKYVLYVIKADPAKITVLDRIFKLNANLLKYLFVRLDDKQN